MRIVLADEISPDSCRLWAVATNEKLDKDRFRRDMGGVEEASQEVARRLGVLPEAGPVDLQGPRLLQSAFFNRPSAIGILPPTARTRTQIGRPPCRLRVSP